MAPLKVHIVNPQNSTRTAAQLPDGVALNYLMPVLVGKLRLSVKDRNGRPIKYHLVQHKTGQPIGDTFTLAQAHVRDEEELLLATETAGEIDPPAALTPIVAPSSEEVLRSIILEKTETFIHEHVKSLKIVDAGEVSSTMAKLFEHREDETRWGAAVWTFIGLLLGEGFNWLLDAGDGHVNISASRLVIYSLFLIAAGLTWKSMRDAKKRADIEKRKIMDLIEPPYL